MKNSIQNSIIFLLLFYLIGTGFWLIGTVQLLIIYFFIALVLSIAINPINNWICNIKIFKHNINTTIATMLCLLIISGFIALIGYLLSPLIIKEVQIISSVESTQITNFLQILTEKINAQFEILGFEQKIELLDLIEGFSVSSILVFFNL